ncbi:MAG: rod shape-determining protein MreC [Bacteroidia bacterium]|nr:rod shape-determining protein MreC [Bacteroidia bacterium]
MILFLLLEGIALYLVVTRNDHQRRGFGDSLMNLSSWAHDQRSSMNEYFRLSAVNEELSLQNQKLHRDLEAAREQLRRQEPLLMPADSVLKPIPDSVKRRETFRFFACRVIRNTVYKDYNYITIDKGSLDSIQVNMGVVSPDGIAGRVVRVSEKYSLVQSVLNRDFRVTVAIVDTGNREEDIGFLEWEGGAADQAVLNYIPETATLSAGDRVFTAYESTLFPPGFMVGYIEEKPDKGQDGFFMAKVRLATQFRKLHTLYVVSAPHQLDLDELDKDITQEE